MNNSNNYSDYKCPYAHIEKDCGHELHGPDGYENVHSVWCACGYRGPVFCRDPDELKLEKIDQASSSNIGTKIRRHVRDSAMVELYTDNGPGGLTLWAVINEELFLPMLSPGERERFDCGEELGIEFKLTTEEQE